MNRERPDITPDDDATLAALGAALPRVSPPADLGDRIRAAAAAEAPQAPVAEVISLDSRRRPRGLRMALAAAACAAAVAVAVPLLVAGDDAAPGPLSASATVVGAAGAPVSGAAEVYGEDAAGGSLHVALANVPPPPAGHHYEVWVLAKGSTEMTSVGSFTPASRAVDLTLPLPAPADYSAVDISVEPNGGAPAHSGVSIAGAKFA